MRTKHPPTQTEKPYAGGDSCSVHAHPAFGLVSLSHPSGSHPTTLFGSDVGHPSTIRVTVHRAEVHRHLSRDWFHQTTPIVEFEMSHAQFAEFITHGNGTQTPCTLTYAPAEESRMERLPGIEAIETRHQTFRREIHEAASERLEAIRNHIERLGAVLDSGKIGKTELREIHRQLSLCAEHLPGSLEFVVKQAEEALDRATSDARIEVEAFISHKAHALGLERISELAQIENRAAAQS